MREDRSESLKAVTDPLARGIPLTKEQLGWTLLRVFPTLPPASVKLLFPTEKETQSSFFFRVPGLFSSKLTSEKMGRRFFFT